VNRRKNANVVKPRTKQSRKVKANQENRKTQKDKKSGKTLRGGSAIVRIPKRKSCGIEEHLIIPSDEDLISIESYEGSLIIESDDDSII
jgi:hypothetical protein